MKALTTFLALASAVALHAGYPDSPLGEGDPLPEGTLFTESGQAFELQSHLDGEQAVLIFYRGGWCPYCNRHLSALADIEQDLLESGFKLYAISPDRPEVLRRKDKLADFSYTLLSDSSMQVSRKFGIAFKVPDDLVEKYKNSYNIDLEGDSGQSHHLLPHPAVYIIDSNGIIRFSYVNENYKVRLAPDKILAAARSIAE